MGKSTCQKVTLNSKQVQKVQLNILSKVVSFCELHNIKYFLIGGTLLGAVRHNGFIPWDDDIDIAMLRPEYEKFLKEWNNGDDSLFLQNKGTDPQVHFSYTKIRLDDTLFIENETANAKTHRGIFIDIFPIDYFPQKASVLDICLMVVRKYLMAVCLHKSGYQIVNFYIKLIVLLTEKLLTISSINSIDRWIVERYGRMKSDYMTSYTSGDGYSKHHMHKEVFENLGSLQFEKYQLSAPISYHEYLTHVYGDYLRLPEPSNRVSPHRVLEMSICAEIAEEWTS